MGPLKSLKYPVGPQVLLCVRYVVAEEALLCHPDHPQDFDRSTRVSDIRRGPNADSPPSITLLRQRVDPSRQVAPADTLRLRMNVERRERMSRPLLRSPPAQLIDLLLRHAEQLCYLAHRQNRVVHTASRRCDLAPDGPDEQWAYAVLDSSPSARKDIINFLHDLLGPLD